MKQQRIIAALVIIIALLIVVGVIGSRKTNVQETLPSPLPTQVKDEVTVSSPKAEAVVTSPLLVQGIAAGNWFFEASLRISVEDANGKTIGQTSGKATGEWMTTNPTPFKGTVAFTKPATATGKLVIQNDNPSDNPAFDKRFEVPIRFTVATTAGSSSGAGATLAACRPSGCSGQICSDTDTMSTCEYRAEYGCYQTAKCERQASGSCGWTQTAELAMCLKNPPALR